MAIGIHLGPTIELVLPQKWHDEERLNETELAELDAQDAADVPEQSNDF